MLRALAICAARRTGRFNCMLNPRRFLVFVAIGIAAIVFAGCANNQQSANATTSSGSTRSYSSDDLQKTGKRTSGEALQAADPAVTTSGGH